MPFIIRSFHSSVFAIDGRIFYFRRHLMTGDDFTLESRKPLLTTTWWLSLIVRMSWAWHASMLHFLQQKVTSSGRCSDFRVANTCFFRNRSWRFLRCMSFTCIKENKCQSQTYFLGASGLAGGGGGKEGSLTRTNVRRANVTREPHRKCWRYNRYCKGNNGITTLCAISRYECI